MASMGDGTTMHGEQDTEILLSLLAEVDEQIAISRGCVHDASSKFEEGKEFESAAAERAKEAQLSEATRKKLQRRAMTITTEVKGEFSKAVAQLRHAAHHYKHARAEIERALRQRDRKVFEFSRSEGRAEALQGAVDESRSLVAEYQRAKEDAEVRAKTLEAELQKTTAQKNSAETHARTLLATIADNEAAMQRQDGELREHMDTGGELQARVESLEGELGAARELLHSTTASKEALAKQLKNSKEVVARITADNLMFLNKIKHTEAKLEQAVREREVLRVELNTNDNRWFEHLRDELQKVTQSHLDAIDQYDAKMVDLKASHESKEEALGRELQELTDKYAASSKDNDALRHDLEAARTQLADLSATHEALGERHAAMSGECGGLQEQRAQLQSKATKLEADLAATSASLRDVQLKLQDSTKGMLEAARDLEVCKGEASGLRDELEKQRDVNEIVMREKGEVERKVYEALAQGDLLGKKNKALVQELSAARQEKDIISRQLAQWATSGIPGSLNASVVS